MFFGTLYTVIQSALIVEWLDTQFMPIAITNDYYDGYFFTWNINITRPEYSEHGYDTRQEATSDAIKKANEIYNKQTPTQ